MICGSAVGECDARRKEEEEEEDAPPKMATSLRMRMTTEKSDRIPRKKEVLGKEAGVEGAKEGDVCAKLRRARAARARELKRIERLLAEAGGCSA